MGCPGNGHLRLSAEGTHRPLHSCCLPSSGLGVGTARAGREGGAEEEKEEGTQRKEVKTVVTAQKTNTTFQRLRLQTQHGDTRQSEGAPALGRFAVVHTASRTHRGCRCASLRSHSHTQEPHSGTHIHRCAPVTRNACSLSLYSWPCESSGSRQLGRTAQTRSFQETLALGFMGKHLP